MNDDNHTFGDGKLLPKYFFPTMEVIGYRQLSGYYHSSKYLILCLTEDTPTGLKQLEGE